MPGALYLTGVAVVAVVAVAVAVGQRGDGSVVYSWRSRALAGKPLTPQ